MQNLLEQLEKIRDILIDRATYCTNSDISDEYVKLRALIIKEINSDFSLKDKMPEVLKKRTLQEFWLFIKNKYKSFAERRAYLYQQFEDILNCLEDKAYNAKNTIEIKPAISNVFIDEQIEKAKYRLNNDDNEGAITIARTLIETIQVLIYEEIKKEHPNHKGDLNLLYKLLKNELNLNPNPDIDKRLNKILSGLNSINEGIADLRNKASDAHPRSFKPKKHHAKLAIYSAFTFCDFLCDTYLYQLEKNQLSEQHLQDTETSSA